MLQRQSNAGFSEFPDPPSIRSAVAPRPKDRQPPGSSHLVGESDALRLVLFRAEQVAATDATVLLCGETGTGKGLLAQMLHQRSHRRDRPLVVVNCASLPAALIESELFGRERGAFTGAHTPQAGRFELAHRGTLFLDEVGELPVELQAKLLRALQDRQFERLGSPRTIEADVRVIAATNRNLLEEVEHGRFRRDLFYRLNVFPLTLPPLRDRRQDIPLLVRHLLDRLAPVVRKSIDGVPADVMRTLQYYDWPGNIRELENVLQRAMIISESTTLSLPADWVTAADSQRIDAPDAGGETNTLMAVERQHIWRVLTGCLWKIEGASGAARVLGMKPSTLRSRMIKLGISRPR